MLRWRRGGVVVRRVHGWAVGELGDSGFWEGIDDFHMLRAKLMEPAESGRLVGFMKAWGFLWYRVSLGLFHRARHSTL